MAGKAARSVTKHSGTKTTKVKSTTAKASKAAGAPKPAKAKAKPLRGGPASSPRVAARNKAAVVQREIKPEKEVYYFVPAQLNLHIATTKPASAEQFETTDSFDELRDKAVDHLIELIDAFERRLWAIKRAQDFADYVLLVESQ